MSGGEAPIAIDLVQGLSRGDAAVVDLSPGDGENIGLIREDGEVIRLSRGDGVGMVLIRGNVGNIEMIGTLGMKMENMGSKAGETMRRKRGISLNQVQAGGNIEMILGNKGGMNPRGRQMTTIGLQHRNSERGNRRENGMREYHSQIPTLCCPFADI